MHVLAFNKNCHIIEEAREDNKGAIHLGNLNGARDSNYLTEHKITHALTALPKCISRNTVFEKLGITQKAIYCEDTPEFNMYVFMDMAADFIHESVQEGNIYVHCAAGISRSTTCLIAYYIKYKRMTMKDAWAFVRSKRGIAAPNYGFQCQLKQFEELHLS